MQSTLASRRLFLSIMTVVMGIGFLSLRLIPVYEPFWGLDFHNIFQFHHCGAATASDPYLVSGADCLDVSARPLVYPPLLFWSFIWVRLFTEFASAMLLWGVITVAAMLGVGAAWIKFSSAHSDPQLRGWLVLEWLLLLGQFPLVFAVERGNNDILVLVVWTLAAAFFFRSRYVTAGIFAGAAMAAKVYPVLAVGVMAIGLLIKAPRVWVRFVGGVTISLGVATVMFWSETRLYVGTVLPGLTAGGSPLTIYSHSLLSLPYAPVVKISLGAVVLGGWAWAAMRRLPDNPALVLAGALAVSTHFSSVSYDYNLIATYPLLLLVISRGLLGSNLGRWRVAAVASVFALASGRVLLAPAEQVALQLVSLAFIAWLVANDNPTEQSSGSLLVVRNGGPVP